MSPRYVTLECENCGAFSGPQVLENHVSLRGWVEDKGRIICPGCWWDMAPVPVGAQRKDRRHA